MALGLGWKLHGDGKTMGPDDVVAPDERLSWGRTVGLGAQHVVAMFGATFVFPLVRGLNPQLAIMMSGIATICFLLIVNGKVPSYLGTSASFVGAVAAIRAQGGTSADVRGAVVMLIGFNLAPVVASIYWPQDQWVALLVMAFTIICAVAFKGFASRIAVFLALIFGYIISWLFDKMFGQITSFDAGAGKVTTHFRTNFDNLASQPWFGLPPTSTTGADGKEIVGIHAPSFSVAAILLVLPAVIALIAENTGHV